MWTKKFWAGVAERALKTFAYTLLALLTAGGPADIVSLNWGEMLGISATATLVSVLGSIVSGVLPVGPTNSPSLVDES